MIRWDQLRSDHGWEALQFQSVLRTSLTVPPVPHTHKTPILIELIQGTEYALVPLKGEAKTPLTWYTGDVYDFASFSSGTRDARGSTSNLARSLLVEPGEYTLLLRAMYGIRMFGDPGVGNLPVIRLKFQAEVDREQDVEVILGTGVMPDVVYGQLMGDWMSVGLRVPAGGEDVVVEEAQADLVGVELAAPFKILAGQLRPLALRIKQTTPIKPADTSLSVALELSMAGRKVTARWQPTLRHQPSPSLPPFRISFASPADRRSGPPALVSYAMVVPPSHPKVTPSGFLPVILATHGAGVEADDPLWTGAMPIRPDGWAVLPTGKTEWGEDWHGGSMADAWAARDALPALLERIGSRVSEDTLLVGHSNGGQGAWHLAARYPDSIVGGESTGSKHRLNSVIATSGWLKIQDYVPYQGMWVQTFSIG